MSKRNTKRVDLTKLFRWFGSFELKDESGEEVMTIYQRVVSDTDFEKARLAAIRKSHAMRTAIRDETTVEYASLMEALERSTKENIVDLIVAQKVEGLRGKAVEEVRTRMPKPPHGDVKLEDTEKYEAAIDEFAEKFNSELVVILTEMLSKEREKLAKLTEEELWKLAKKSWEDQLCTNIANATLLSWVAYLGTYTDDTYTTRLFSSFEEFEELAEEVKAQIINGYESITTHQEELKN